MLRRKDLILLLLKLTSSLEAEHCPQKIIHRNIVNGLYFVCHNYRSIMRSFSCEGQMFNPAVIALFIIYRCECFSKKYIQCLIFDLLYIRTVIYSSASAKIKVVSYGYPIRVSNSILIGQTNFPTCKYNHLTNQSQKTIVRHQWEKRIDFSRHSSCEPLCWNC